MAGPLAAFRKYQKILLAVFGVALMLVFTVGGLVSQYLGASPQGAAENPVVVQWKDGQLRESELQMHRYARNQLRQFQQAVIQIAMERGASQDIFRNAIVPNTDSEASVVQTLLLAREAEQLGVVISDQAILRHLKHLSDDTIPQNELAAILQGATGGRMSQQQLFDRMRNELKAHQVRLLANGAAFDGGVTDTAVSPGESFEYFKRLQRRMEAEVMPIAVADYVNQVKEEPTEAEIKKLYEEYKDDYPSLDSPSPGFRRPVRAAFQWLKADFQDFLDRKMENVTDQEIEDYYEENKNSYRKPTSPTPDDVQNTEDTVEQPASDPAGQPADADLEDPEKEPTAENEPAAENESPSEPDSIGEPESDASDDADLEDPENEPAAEKEPTAANESPSEPDSIGEPESDASTDTDAEATDEAEGGAQENIEYQPLEEVRDDIARELARPRAIEAVNGAVLAASAQLRRYFENHVLWEANPERERGPRPPLPDFKKLAEKLGMVAGEIPLISSLEANEYDLGRAFELDFSTGQIRRIPFIQMGFDPDLSLYQPRSISAPDVDSQFVFWKVEEEEEKVPTLDEAREDIVRHWKMRRAMELARAQAKEYAQQVRDRQKPLSEVFGSDENLEVIDTGEFTWMTFGSTPTGSAAPRRSEVEGTQFVGEQFMRDVSELRAGEVTVTHNHPETAVYVVYVESVSNSQEELREMFLNNGLNLPVLFMARQENMQTAVDWYENLERSWGLEWERPPDSFR